MDDTPSIPRGLAWMLGACLAFACMALCVAGVHRVDPTANTFAVSAVRAVVNLIVLLVMARGDARTLIGDARPALWTRGVLGALALLTYFAALSSLGAGEAAFLNQTSAVWVALLAPRLVGEPTKPIVWVAVLGSMIGMALLAHPRADVHDASARLIGLSSGVFAAGAYLSIRRAGSSNSSTVIVFWFTWIATVFATVGAVVMQVTWPQTQSGWLLSCGSGVFATIGQLMMTQSYRIAPLAPMSAATAAGPLLTTILAALVLGQVPDTSGFFGMAVLLISAVVLPLINVRASAGRPPP